MANEPLRGSKGSALQALQKRKGYKFFSTSSFIWVLEVRPTFFALNWSTFIKEKNISHDFTFFSVYLFFYLHISQTNYCVGKMQIRGKIRGLIFFTTINLRCAI